MTGAIDPRLVPRCRPPRSSPPTGCWSG